MGLLVNGAWQEDISRTKEGRFIRPTPVFRNFVTRDGSPGASGWMLTEMSFIAPPPTIPFHEGPVIATYYRDDR